MADPIRLSILNALVSKMQGITVAAGYRHTVDTVEIIAKAFDDPTVNVSTVPWIGIIPQRETITDEPFGHQKIDWSIQFVCHFAVATKTAIGIATECAAWVNDIRKALYSDQTLGVAGVIRVWMTGRQGSEGSQEAIRRGLASILCEVNVRFQENVSDD